MTHDCKKRKSANGNKIAGSLPQIFSGFFLEARRCARGMYIEIGSIVNISNFTDNEITLKTHSGKINIRGARLSIIIFEFNTVRITGRIEEVGFSYGKN